MKTDEASRLIVEDARDELLRLDISQIDPIARQIDFLVIVMAQADEARIEDFAVQHHSVILVEMAIERLRTGSWRSDQHELLTRLHSRHTRWSLPEHTQTTSPFKCERPLETATAGALK
ncbi:hypothetical protein, partial [Mesorhizobium sp.]|uniref:hypothetical protein n=1 Tax=Mesorhizobium sp. TaxID=1871066 RepID=UPI0025B9F371